VDILGLQSGDAEIFEQCRQQYRNGHCYATTQHLVIAVLVLGIYFEIPTSL
jgi:hypothetical protein